MQFPIEMICVKKLSSRFEELVRKCNRPTRPIFHLQTVANGFILLVRDYVKSTVMLKNKTNEKQAFVPRCIDLVIE